jgi:hypothetical protein
LEGRGRVWVATRVPPLPQLGQGRGWPALGALATYIRGRGRPRALEALDPRTPNPSCIDHRHHLTAGHHRHRTSTTTLIVIGPLHHHHFVVVDFLSLACAERYPSSTSIPLVTRKRCQIFTNIFCLVRVLDHTFDTVMPSSYVWIPSKVLHV